MKDATSEPASGSPLQVANACLLPLGESIDRDMLMELGLAMQQAPVFRSENHTLPAGYTYLSQLVDHDMMFFTSAHTAFSGGAQAVPLTNHMNPELDLKVVYGNGFDDPAAPADSNTGCLVLHAPHGAALDLPRYQSDYGQPGSGGFIAKGTPRIPDRRSDDHLLLSQLHLLFMSFHNAVAQRLKQGDGRQRYHQARNLVQQVYLRLIEQDLLKRLLLNSVWQATFGAQQQKLPALFTDEQLLSSNLFHLAVFRFGHSLVRENYALNDNQQVRLTGLFDFRVDRGYFQNHHQLPDSHRVDWRYFFGPDAQNAMLIQPVIKLVIPMLSGPMAALSVRNLLRGYEQQVPSAQSLVTYLASQPAYQRLLQPDLMIGPHNMDMPGVKGLFGKVRNGQRFCHQTPLWYYVLREAYETRIRGCSGQLGPVASIVVASVFAALLRRSQVHNPEPMPAWLTGITDMHQLAEFVHNH